MYTRKTYAASMDGIMSDAYYVSEKLYVCTPLNSCYKYIVLSLKTWL